jgi:hypothetical protein
MAHVTGPGLLRPISGEIKMRECCVLAGVILAAVVVAGQPAGSEPAAGEAAASGWQAEALAVRTGTWNVTTTYTMPGLAMDSDLAVAERTIVEGDVLLEEVTGTMLQMPYVGEARSGYDAGSGRFWTTWTDWTAVSDVPASAVILYGTYDPQTATYTYQGTIADPMLGDALMQIAWTIDGPGRETVVYSADSSNEGLIEVMRQDYARVE